MVRGYPSNWKIHEKPRRKRLSERPIDRTYTEHKEDNNITLKLLNIQGLTKQK